MVAKITACELWCKLQIEAGLELRLKNGRRGRDADLEDAVMASLLAKVPSLAGVYQRLSVLLLKAEKSKLSQITTEQLLVAVLTSQGGFSAMMEDILNTLISAAAHRGENEMRLAFRFGAVNDPIHLTLEQFREQVRSVRQVLETRFEPPDSAQLWDIWHLLREIASETTQAVAPESNPDAFLPPPALVGTGDADLDATLSTILSLVTQFRAWCRGYASHRRDFWVVAGRVMDAPTTRDDERQHLSKWRGAVSDRWDSTTVEHVSRIEVAVNAGTLSAAFVVRELQPLLAVLPMRDVWVDQTYTRLVDILRLPTWRKRHELYSVWVGTVLLRTAQHNADKFQFHAKEGALSFAFGGNRLATYEYESDQFDIWAELRSDLVGHSGKRKRGIQPDFRIVRVALNKKVNDATHFVLECKHYLAPSVSNFTQAADDYSRSCPNSSTFIVNHGMADHGQLIAKVPAATAGCIRFVGGATAEQERVRPNLQEIIRDTLFKPKVGEALSIAMVARSETLLKSDPAVLAPLPENPGVVASIVLEWNNTLEDVDLELEAIDSSGNVEHTVAYTNTGSLVALPYARLIDDVREGPGREVIELARWTYPRYKIVVRNYSKIGELSAVSVSCRVQIHGSWTSLMKPASTPGSEWVVAIIEAVGQEPLVKMMSGTISSSPSYLDT